MSTKKDFQKVPPREPQKMLKVLYRITGFLAVTGLLLLGYAWLPILRRVSCDIYHASNQNLILLGCFILWIVVLVLSLVCLGMECWMKRFKGILGSAVGFLLWLGLPFAVVGEFIFYCSKTSWVEGPIHLYLGPR